MRTNKNTSKIILAIIVAFLATMISYSGFKNMRNQLNEQQQLINVMQKTNAGSAKESYAYATATTDLNAGDIVADTDVDFKQFDTKETNTFENRSDVVNKVLLKSIKSGEVYTNAHIAKISNDDVTLRDGYRALTLPSDNFQGKSDKMTAGSFVDVYSASSDSDWVLENVRIVSFESNKALAVGVPPGITNASAITFEVPADSISDFISNISKNKLMLVERSPNDQKTYHKRGKRAHGNSDGEYSANSMNSLPNLPKSVPIKNFPGGNLSGLPQPLQPAAQQSAVEVIEANVKSKVTFD